MATEKDRAFVEFILEQTKAGKLKWEVTADESKFTVSFKGKYKVTVDRYYDGDRDTFRFWLTLFDESERELLRVNAGESSLVPELFFLAQRNSLNVDHVIDEIMSDKPLDASSPVTDEDIPF